MTTISLIAAMGRNRVIGRSGALPWRLPDDMRFFMRTTTGHAVIMGRKTWETMDKPLPNRRNIVVTRQADYHAAGAEVVASLDEAIARTADESEVFIIGGGEIYQLALPIAHRLYITHVEGEFEGDAKFPEFDASRWRAVTRQHHDADDRHAHAFKFVMYERM